MAKIGSQDGITAAVNRLRDLDPGGTLLVKTSGGWPDISTLPSDVSKWKAYDKLQRTLQILKDDHDAVNPKPPEPTPEFPTVPSRSVGKNGLYFYNLYDVQGAINFAKANNLWVAILVNECEFTPQREGSRLPESYIFGLRDQLKAAGVLTIASGWAEPYGDLDAQAQFIGHMAQGFDEYLLNIEAAWAYEAGADAFGRSDIFAPKVRAALGPNMPLSLSCDWGNNIHWKPWLDVGASAVRVQCYTNEWPHKNPKEAIELLGRDQHDLVGGVPASMREVTYGKYGAYLQPLSQWTSLDDQAGKPPRSVWAAEFADSADASWLAR